MGKQLTLDMELPEREDLAEARGYIKILKKQAADRGWRMTARYRKKQRKFYFNLTIPRSDKLFWNSAPSTIPQAFLRQYFPEAYLTSGGFGWGGDADFTYAERGDRDKLDRPVRDDPRTTERGW